MLPYAARLTLARDTAASGARIKCAVDSSRLSSCAFQLASPHHSVTAFMGVHARCGARDLIYMLELCERRVVVAASAPNRLRPSARRGE